MQKISYERFTDRARKSMQLANQEAQRFNHDEVAPVHILLGILKEGGGVAAHVLKRLGKDAKSLRDATAADLLARTSREEVLMGRLPLTTAATNALACALEESHSLGHNYVGTEHMFLGLLRNPIESLTWFGLTADKFREEMIALLKQGDGPSKSVNWPSQKSLRVFATARPSKEGKPSDYERTYDEFWKSLVENPDGSLNLDAVKRELHDFHNVLEQVSKVYSHVTGGRISKANTLAEEVIAVADDSYRETYEATSDPDDDEDDDTPIVVEG